MSPASRNGPPAPRSQVQGSQVQGSQVQGPVAGGLQGAPLWEEFFEEVPLGLALADPSLRYVRLNRAYEAVLGCGPPVASRTSLPK